MRGNHEQNPTARVLLIEDDDRFAQALVSALAGEGFDVERVDNGLEGLSLATSHAWSAVILDLMIPLVDGSSVLRRLRRESTVPVLVLTATHSLDQKVGRLEDGADDYLTKPFELPELVARLHSLMRRAAGAPGRFLSLGDVEIDLYSRDARRDGESLALTATEFRILELLMRHRGSAVSTQRLAEVLSTSGDPVLSATVRTHVRNLRHKVGEDLVQTRRGYGYLIPEGLSDGTAETRSSTA